MSSKFTRTATKEKGEERQKRILKEAKNEKDSNKPKKALTAFFHYAGEERSKIRAENPDFTMGEVAKVLGKQWRELSAKSKAQFEKQASDDRARYAAAMEAYKAGEALPMKKDVPMKKAKTNGHKVATPDSDEEPAKESDEGEVADSDEEADSDDDK